jgi:hypothetical protein
MNTLPKSKPYPFNGYSYVEGETHLLLTPSKPWPVARLRGDAWANFEDDIKHVHNHWKTELDYLSPEEYVPGELGGIYSDSIEGDLQFVCRRYYAWHQHRLEYFRSARRPVEPLSLIP